VGASLLLVVILFVAVESNEFENKNKKHEKERKLGHWGEHWTPETAGEGDPPHIKEIMKHAPGSISQHEAHLQSDVTHKKPIKHKNGKKQKAQREEALMQDLLLAETAHQKTFAGSRGREQLHGHQTEHGHQTGHQAEHHGATSKVHNSHRAKSRTPTQHHPLSDDIIPTHHESHRLNNDRAEKKERKNKKVNKMGHKKHSKEAKDNNGKHNNKHKKYINHQD